MSYVEVVEGTLKGGVSVRLGEKTVLVGRNGAGKSAIVQTIELATKGSVSDMEGRGEVKVQAALARLFPPGIEKRAHIVMSDGAECSWEMHETRDGGLKKPITDVNVKLRWLIPELTATLGSEQNTVSSWLEGQVIGKLKESDILSAMPPAVRDMVKELVKATKLTDFIALAKAARDQARSMRTDATKRETSVETLLVGVEPPLEDYEITALETEYNVRRERVRGVSSSEMSRMREAAGALAGLVADLDAQEAALPVADDRTARAFKLLSSARDIGKRHEKELGLDSCWVCGNDTKDAVARHQKELAQAHEGMGPTVKVLTQRQEIQQERAKRMAELQTLATKIKDSGGTSDDEWEELDALRARILSAAHNQKIWRNASAEQSICAQFRAKADLLTLSAKNLEDAGERLLKRKKKEFEDSITKFLPEGDEAGVDIDTARIGLIRNGQLHTALSGAEWSRILLAILAAQGARSTPTIAVPADRAWDRDTLTSVMKSLSSSPGQVIIMSTVAPEDVEGWTIVRVGIDEHNQPEAV